MKTTGKILKSFLVFLPVLAFTLGIGTVLRADAAGYLSVPGALCNLGFPCPSGSTAVEMTRNLAGRIVDNVRYIIGAVAVVVFIVSGVKLITGGGNEETYSKETTNLTFAIVGLAFVVLAGDLAAILEVDKGGFLKAPNVMTQKGRLFNQAVQIIITFIKYIIGSVSVVYIVRSGTRLVLMGGNEEEIGKAQKNIFYGFLGLIIILTSNSIINTVFFKIDANKIPGNEGVNPAADPVALAKTIAGMTNLVAAIAGPFTLLSLMAGALMYTFAAGDEEKTGKAKKIIMWSAVGLIIIYGAFAIVSTFVARRFEGL